MATPVRAVRAICLLVHRWTGIAIAAFLVVAALTGTLLAYGDALDRLLNPTLFHVAAKDAPLRDPIELIAILEDTLPTVEVVSVPLQLSKDSSARFEVRAREPEETDNNLQANFDEVFVDPYSGEVLGTRDSLAAEVTRAHFVTWVYDLHYALLLPEPVGRWLFGGIALVWTANCIIGLYLSMPSRAQRFWRNWRWAWMIRKTKSTFVYCFDLHRAGSLWALVPMLVFAVSSVSLNLYQELFHPLLRNLMEFHFPHDGIGSDAAAGSSELDWQSALTRGRELMSQRAGKYGFQVLSEESLQFDALDSTYVYSVNSTFDIRKEAADTSVYFKAKDGAVLGVYHPYTGAGTATTHWLTALHTGQVGGAGYQFFVCLMGVIVSAISVTGVLVWWWRR